MAWIEDAFAKRCREKFKFLEEEFGFRRQRQGIRIGPNYMVKPGPGYVLYMNQTTAVSVGYHPVDGDVQVGLMRLVDGKPAPYGDLANYQPLWVLAQVRAPGTPSEWSRGYVHTKEEIEAALTADAAMVREHAADILRGDFSVFPELTRVRAEVVRQRTAGSGGADQPKPP